MSPAMFHTLKYVSKEEFCRHYMQKCFMGNIWEKTSISKDKPVCLLQNFSQPLIC